MPAPIRGFTRPATWHQVDGARIWTGDVPEEPDGHRMSAGFGMFAEGESAAVPAPYDEVWAVTKGRLTIHAAGDPVRAEAGDIVYVPAGTPGNVHAEQDLEMVLAAHPPRWTFHEQDWSAVRSSPRVDAVPHVFTTKDVDTWQELSGQNGYLGYAADGAPVDAFGLGYGRASGEMSLEFRFPYDEIIVVLDGEVAVHSDGSVHTAPAGGLVYLPTGSFGTFQAGPGASLVFVHHPSADTAGQEWTSSLPLVSPEVRAVPAEQVWQ